MLNESETADPGESGGSLTPKQIRILKIAIGIMSVLLVVGFILLLVGIYYQSSRHAAPGGDPRLGLQRQLDAPVPLMNVPMRPGAQIANILADQGRLILHLHSANSDELVVIDLASGWQQQRITLSPQ